MMASTRRGALTAVLGFGISASFLPARVLASGPLALPDGPLRFTRKLTRSLSGGAELRVERSWRVTMGAQGRGYTVLGEQIAVSVDGPSSLAELAALEEARSTDGMWPILLSGSGLVVGAGRAIRDDDIARAATTARAIIERRVPAGSQREARMRYLADLLNAGAPLLEAIPHDLFFPTAQPLRAVRAVDLPGGLSGEFEVSYTAVAVPGMGWLDHATRQVTTRLEGSEQTAREEWHLRPL